MKFVVHCVGHGRCARGGEFAEGLQTANQKLPVFLFLVKHDPACKGIPHDKISNGGGYLAHFTSAGHHDVNAVRYLSRGGDMPQQGDALRRQLVDRIDKQHELFRARMLIIYLTVSPQRAAQPIMPHRGEAARPASELPAVRQLPQQVVHMLGEILGKGNIRPAAIISPDCGAVDGDILLSMPGKSVAGADKGGLSGIPCALHQKNAGRGSGETALEPANHIVGLHVPRRQVKAGQHDVLIRRIDVLFHAFGLGCPQNAKIFFSLFRPERDIPADHAPPVGAVYVSRRIPSVQRIKKEGMVPIGEDEGGERSHVAGHKFLRPTLPIYKSAKLRCFCKDFFLCVFVNDCIHQAVAKRVVSPRDDAGLPVKGGRLFQEALQLRPRCGVGALSRA